MSWLPLSDGVTTIGTGDKIRVEGFIVAPEGTYSIAGAQPKVIGNKISVSGELRHVRGNHPLNPSRIWLYFKQDEGITNEGCSVTARVCDKCGGLREDVIELTPSLKVTILDPSGPYRTEVHP